MNEKERDFSTMDLEDIVKEFGGGKYPPVSDKMVDTAELLELSAVLSGANVEISPRIPEPAPEETPEQPLPEVPAAPEESAVPEVQEQTPAPVTEDTVRLEAIRDAQVREEAPQVEESTVRLEKLPEHLTAEETPEPEETSAPEPVPEDTKEAQAEYYDDEDEDEVELPELPPLIFKPKSKLQQLRSALVAGPERRFYELSGIGVGKVQLAILASILLILLSGTTAVMYVAGMIAEKRLKLMIFGQILAMLVSGLLGSQQMIEGICDLFRGRFTMNTLLGVTFCACCADSVFCLMEERVPFCAAFSLQVMMSLWSAYHKRTTEMGQMDSLRKAVRLNSLTTEPGGYEGKTVFVRGEGKVEDFMAHYDLVSGPERGQNIFAFLCLLAAIAVAVLAGMLHSSVSLALQLLSTTLLVAAPASMFITLTRPEALVERKLHSLGTVICGWSGVKGLCVKGILPLKDKDLFPTGSTKLNGVKFYGQRDPDEVIAYTASLIQANGGCLKPVFEHLLKARNGQLQETNDLRHYGNGGIGGMVNGEPVLIGTLDFLKEMGVEVPENTMVRQAVYAAIDGEFSGLFAINYSRTKFTAGGMATLNSHRVIRPLVIARDFMLTPEFLKEKFGIKEKRFFFPERAECDALAAKQPAEDRNALALTTLEGLAPVVYAITGARALRTASRLGLTIHIIGGVLGMLTMAALAILGAVHLLTPVHILLYQLIWTIPGLLVTTWPRTM